MNQTIKTKNPATNQSLDEYTLLTPEQLEEAIDHSYDSWLAWRRSSFDTRKKLMMKAANVLEHKQDRYAAMMTREMGKVLDDARAEVKKSAWVCRYYAENAEKFLADELVEADVHKSLISYQPLGPVLAVMPWNYPFWQVFRFAAPTIMAGNTALLKHASNVPGSALMIEEVFTTAGFPKGIFQSLLIKSSSVEGIIANPKVKAVTLTGSGPAGSAVASAAGKHIKKSVLELGGSDPYIVLEDADLDLAAAQCAESRLLNAGQSCIGAKRFIVVEEVFEAFVEKFKEKMESAIVGDPNEAVKIGPLARHYLRDEVHDQVVRSVDRGAELILGGTIPDHEGAFYPPTILTNVSKGMPAYEEEIFGPVASVIRVKDEKEAIFVANDTSFGLGGAVFTRDLERGERIAKYEIQSGACFVNHFVKSDPRLPFGGINTSGFGRELGIYGIREFVNIKTVSIEA